MIIKGLSFGDVHAPLHSESAVEWLYQKIETIKPEIIVCNGDAYDGDAWSRWDNDNTWTIMDEYRAWAKIVSEINKLAPNARKIWLYGNHEDNLRQAGRVNKKLRRMVEWKEWDPRRGISLRDEVKDWKVIDKYGSTVRYSIGPITWTHGTKFSINSARDEARMLGSQFGLTISGHTHRIVPVTRDMFPGNIPADMWFCNPGCLYDFSKATYMARMNYQAWGHGCVEFEIYSKDKTLINEGRKIYSSKIWDAEVHIRTIARDVL